jgi:hypothetical protein
MPMTRNTWAAAAATIVVVAVIVLGLRDLGGPQNQRQLQSDLRTLQTLSALAQQIQFAWHNSGQVLPASLDQFPATVTQDPSTGKRFAYHPKSASGYELCATFATDTRNLPPQNPPDPLPHPKGDHCFQLDAAQQVPQAPFVY